MKNLIVFLMVVALAACGKSSENEGGSTPPSPWVGARFAYVMNQGDRTVSQYEIAADGSLRSMAQAEVSVGNGPGSMVMDSQGRFVYVVNTADNNISEFAIRADGSLASLGAPVPTGLQPLALVMSPDDSHLYVMNSLDNEVSRYSIGSDGTLTLISQTPNGDYPLNMSFSPNGKFAYVVNLQDTISQYSVDASGALTALTPFTVPTVSCSTGPIMSHSTRGGDFLYVLSCWDSKVDVFSIGVTGQLTSLGSVNTGLSPEGMSISGSHLYVANSGDGNVSAFLIETNGSLTPSLAPVNAGTAPETLTIDAARKAAYVIDFAESAILQYSVDADGALVRTSAATVNTGAYPMKILLK